MEVRRVKRGSVGDILSVPEYPRHARPAPGVPRDVDVYLVHLAVEADVAKVNGGDHRPAHPARDLPFFAAGLGECRERRELDLALLAVREMFQSDDRLRHRAGRDQIRQNAPPGHREVLAQVLHGAAVNGDPFDPDGGLPAVPDIDVEIAAQTRVLGMVLFRKGPALVPGHVQLLRNDLVRTEEGQIHPLITFKGALGCRKRKESATAEKARTY